MDFQRMLNYMELPEKPPIHYVKMIKCVRDVAEYLREVQDMGCGISVFNLEIPKDSSIDAIIEKFRTSKVIRRTATPVTRFSKEDPDFKSLCSIEHIGEKNCHFGIYHCGGDEHDKYRLLVCSYDITSSMNFNNRITRQLERSFRKAQSEQQLLKTECLKVPVEHLMKTTEYRQAIFRGYLNRRIIAAIIFKELGIAFGAEDVVDELLTKKKLVSVRVSDVIENYETVCLRQKDMYAQFYCHCYKTSELQNGAPWFRYPHKGYYSFYQSRLNIADLKDMMAKKQNGGPSANGGGETHLNVFVPDGAPLGIPRNFVPTSESINTNIVRDIDKRVHWNSEMSIMMFADPKLFMPSENSFKELEEAYNLGIRRFHLWKTLAMFVSPPDQNNLSLRVQVKFSTQKQLKVSYKMFREINHMYISIVNYWDICPIKNLAWSISSLPRFSVLYGEQSVNLMEATMEISHLRTIIQAFDMFEQLMAPQIEESESLQEQYPFAVFSGPITPRIPVKRPPVPLEARSDVSDIELNGQFLTESDIPLDEMKRDRPAKSVNYNVVRTDVTSADERLGDPDMIGSSSVSDMDTMPRAKLSYREIASNESERYKEYIEQLMGVGQEQNWKRMPGAKDTAPSESTGEKRRRRRKKVTEPGVGTSENLEVSNFYRSGPPGRDYILTSEDDSILHKN